MCAAVDVRVVRTVVVRNLINHLIRLLCRCTIIQPHEVVAVHLLLQHGEVLLDLLRVQRVGLFIVQVTQFLRLRDADAEAIVCRQR